MSSTLHVQVMGGLVSRMRAVVGAIACCEATGRRLKIDWPKAEPIIDGFRATFHDLWSNDYEVTSGGGAFPKRLSDLSGSGDVRFRTCHLVDFMPYYTKPLREYIAVLKPSAEVALFSHQATAHFKRPTVGLATRCTNNHPMMAKLGWFEQRMTALAKQFTGVQFYLSCDTQAAFNRLSAPCLGRCITQDKTYKYDRIGIMKSAADLYTLAACDWVIGTNHSSYSEMVALMRGATLSGTHTEPGSLSGGNYEDAWNLHTPSDITAALGGS